MISKKCIKINYLAVFLVFFIVFVGASVSVAVEKININTASVETLMQLERVGESYAQKIVEYREKVGPFQTPEEIMNVKGIGEKTWEANKDRIVISQSQ